MTRAAALADDLRITWWGTALSDRNRRFGCGGHSSYEPSCGLQNVGDICRWYLRVSNESVRAASADGAWLAKQEILALSLGS